MKVEKKSNTEKTTYIREGHRGVNKPTKIMIQGDLASQIHFSTTVFIFFNKKLNLIHVFNSIIDNPLF